MLLTYLGLVYISLELINDLICFVLRVNNELIFSLLIIHWIKPLEMYKSLLCYIYVLFGA